MRYTVIGIEKVNYTNKSGVVVEGLRIHLTFEKKNCDGLAVETVYMSYDLGAGLSVGNEIELYYNKFGRPVHVAILA